jgi:TPR repeat protein
MYSNSIGRWLAVHILLSSFAIAAAAQQESPEQSPQDWQKSRAEETLSKAKAGDGAAQFDLSLIYRSGDGVEKDLAEADYWLQKSAENNFPDAQVDWAKWFFRRQEYRESMEWFRKAAQAGNADAQHWMAYLYHHGIGVERDFAASMQWDMKAAANGLSDAMDAIGYMYEHDEGVTRDYAEAMKWYKRAADAGNVHAQSNLASMYFNGHGVPQDLAKAAELFAKPADDGLAEAQFALGFILAGGLAGKKDHTQGISLLQKAAAQNDPNASAYLALLYVADDFPELPHDRERARKLAEALAAQGSLFAERAMAVVESENEHYKEAVDWYQKAADQGDVVSVLRLAQFYRDGKGVKADLGMAARLFKRAIEMDDNGMFLNEAAWFFATASDPKVRDPEAALRYALRAQKQDENSFYYLHTLAEAYFANGDVAQAISTDRRALALQPNMPQIKESLARFEAASKESHSEPAEHNRTHDKSP